MDDFDREYDALANLLEGLKVTVDTLIPTLLEIDGIRFHSVTSRIKSKASTRQKLQRPDKKRELGDLTDTFGVRVITYFQDEVDTVAKLIEREFIVDRENSVDKRALLNPDRFGYLSLHYVLKLNAERSTLTENRAYRDVRFELQIRSMLQHTWAEIEHDTGYKSESEVPDAVRRRFSRLAGLLELADDEFLEIRNELAKSADLQRSRTIQVKPKVERILTRPALVGLPDWDMRVSERDYIRYTASSDPRFLVLDRVLLPIPSTRGYFEACDLLGPNDELIHVSNPRNSAAFGHLFNQALVSAEILHDSSEARQALIATVEERGEGRTLASDFYPREVVLALPSAQAPSVPISKIPPFSHFTLSRVSEALEDRGITLRVTGINTNGPILKSTPLPSFRSQPGSAPTIRVASGDLVNSAAASATPSTRQAPDHRTSDAIATMHGSSYRATFEQRDETWPTPAFFVETTPDGLPMNMFLATGSADFLLKSSTLNSREFPS